ncbi:MAG: hypothetical protein QG610_1971 [Euryarchaeota archaeon]|nr:hypothetical protein [Euryarchaeota archaeon]
MLRTKKFVLKALVVCMAVGFFMAASSASAQYWQNMPPYNVLWPLWTQSLSPVDPLTGVATPLVSSLTSTTVLPVMPAFVWDIEQTTPWFLYNAPAALGSGLYYFDILNGFNTFPPPDHLLPGGGIFANPLPLGYETLIPAFDHFDLFALTANNAYSAAFGSYLGATPYLNLLTPAALWGAPPFPYVF